MKRSFLVSRRHGQFEYTVMADCAEHAAMQCAKRLYPERRVPRNLYCLRTSGENQLSGWFQMYTRVRGNSGVISDCGMAVHVRPMNGNHVGGAKVVVIDAEGGAP